MINQYAADQLHTGCSMDISNNNNNNKKEEKQIRINAVHASISLRFQVKQKQISFTCTKKKTC